MTAQICFGIDPNPLDSTFESFRQCVQAHIDFLNQHKKWLQNPKQQPILKPQLAFFLAYGSRGIALLEELIHTFRHDHTIILDGKFNEIENSLKAYLKFVFSTLKVHGVTINPFLGEKTLELTFETCAKEVGAQGRVYVLCVTSENSKNELSYLQKDYKHILSSCMTIRDHLFGPDEGLCKIPGVVVGANRSGVLFSDQIRESQLSILSPGLGAQGADWSVVQKCSLLDNEVIFPLSRGIFDAGNATAEDIWKNFEHIYPYFH